MISQGAAFDQNGNRDHGYLPRGAGWYKRAVAVSDGGSAWLHFEGAYRDTDVYVVLVGAAPFAVLIKPSHGCCTMILACGYYRAKHFPCNPTSTSLVNLVAPINADRHVPWFFVWYGGALFLSFSHF